MGSKNIYLQYARYGYSLFFILDKKNIKISFSFATLEQLFNDFEVTDYRFDIVNHESYVLVPSHMFFGNIAKLNQNLSIHVKKH
jgi:hypothetical protein